MQFTPITVCLLLSSLLAGPVFAAESAVRAFDLAIPGAGVVASPRVLRVLKDDVVRLKITGEAAGEIHLHAYRLEAKVAPGAPAELSFTARATGRFRIEWHRDDATTKKGDHHGPPLAFLEVRPK